MNLLGSTDIMSSVFISGFWAYSECGTVEINCLRMCRNKCKSYVSFKILFKLPHTGAAPSQQVQSRSLSQHSVAICYSHNTESTTSCEAYSLLKPHTALRIRSRSKLVLLLSTCRLYFPNITVLTRKYQMYHQNKMQLVRK